MSLVLHPEYERPVVRGPGMDNRNEQQIDQTMTRFATSSCAPQLDDFPPCVTCPFSLLVFVLVLA